MGNEQELIYPIFRRPPVAQIILIILYVRTGRRKRERERESEREKSEVEEKEVGKGTSRISAPKNYILEATISNPHKYSLYKA